MASVMEMQSREMLFYKRRTLSYNDLKAEGRRKGWYPGKGRWYMRKKKPHMHKHAIVDTVCTRAKTQPHMHKIATTAAVCHMTTERPPRETERESKRIETRTPNPSVCLFWILLHLQACASICTCVSLCMSRSWSVWPHLHHCSCVRYMVHFVALVLCEIEYDKE